MDDRHTPAGWYPDPLGLPQLRWWDGQGWGEHTSEARRPLLSDQARTVTFADSVLPADMEVPITITTGISNGGASSGAGTTQSDMRDGRPPTCTCPA